MEENCGILDRFFLTLFNDILKIEEKTLTKGEFCDISMTDMHIIDAISFDGSKNMSSVAKILDITVGTLTIAINNLVKKGYVKRIRSSKDRRVVLISLSPKGEKAYRHHERFHREMVNEIIDSLEKSELDILNKALTKLDNYFFDKYKAIK